MKNIAKVSAMSALAPLASTLGCSDIDDRQISLNVILHGLFVLNFTDTCIELLAPKIGDHMYKIGNWDRRETYCLEQNAKYKLAGVKPEGVPPVYDNPNYAVAFSQQKCQFNLNYAGSHFYMQVPFPTTLRLLRRVGDGNPPQCPASPNSTGQYPVGITSLSLCQVLTYQVPHSHELSVNGIDWRPRVEKGTPFANLHLWAEPPKRLTPAHAYHAYQTLSEMLAPLYLQLKVCSTAPVENGIPGVPPEQQQGWSEWASGGGEGSYPTNCCAVITRK